MVPHLITALTGPINELEQRILESMPAIERWFRLEWMEHTPPFYSSVDLRNAGFKLAPVDTNLFPGGWNNLTPEMLPLAVQAAMAAIEKICPEAKNLLLVPEKHTRNTFYLTNVQRLTQIFHQAGLNVRLGTLDPEIKAPTTLSLPDGSTLVVEPLVRTRGRLGLKDFDPCTILLNNDLSAGIPKVLEDLHEQYLLPPLHAGWAVRRKTHHFQSYEEVAKKFAKLLGMDPWLINPMFAQCGEVNFTEGPGIECVQSNADALIDQDPAQVQGIRHQREALRRRQGRQRHLRHGHHDRARRQGARRAEPAHQEQDERHQGWPGGHRGDHPGGCADLRARQRGGGRAGGLHDRPLRRRRLLPRPCRARHRREPERARRRPSCRWRLPRVPSCRELGAKPGASAPNRFYMYGVIARLAMLAASYELEATDPDAEIYD